MPSSVYTPEDIEVEFAVSKTDTIYSLKQQIFHNTKVPAKEQKLLSEKPRKSVRAGKLEAHPEHDPTKNELREFKQDTWMLSEYDIEEGDTIIVHLSSGWRPPWWLLLFTALELVLVHLDHRVPPRCVNVLDLNSQYGECEMLLRSGEFTCAHDFCPTCSSETEGYQDHQCDLSCGFCPEPPAPCPATPEARPCVNALDEAIGDGHCDTLIRSGAASCSHDFCYDCQGATGSAPGVGVGGHQAGKCDSSCNLCAQAPDPPNCTDTAVTYPAEELPDGYLWETPWVSEALADVSRQDIAGIWVAFFSRCHRCGQVIVLLVNGCGAAVIIRQDKMRQPSHAQLEVVQVRRRHHPQDLLHKSLLCSSHCCAQERL